MMIRRRRNGIELRGMDQEQFQKITKALADPRRFEILSRIAGEKELACNDIRCQLPITAATLSHHLKELCNAGLISVRKDARYMHMKLRRKTWREYLKRLEKL
jgi:ArsR family transcriptional regulator, arsenate/arsenite/antimonite-responsive transcriptional repressor